MARKSNKTTGESSINDASSLLNEMSDIEAAAIADQYRQTVVNKALELIVSGNSAGPKTKAIISQFKAGLYEAVGAANREAIEVTVSEEELEQLKLQALGGYINPVSGLNSADEMKALMGG